MLRLKQTKKNGKENGNPIHYLPIWLAHIKKFDDTDCG